MNSKFKVVSTFTTGGCYAGTVQPNFQN